MNGGKVVWIFRGIIDYDSRTDTSVVLKLAIFELEANSEALEPTQALY